MIQSAVGVGSSNAQPQAQAETRAYDGGSQPITLVWNDTIFVFDAVIGPDKRYPGATSARMYQPMGMANAPPRGIVTECPKIEKGSTR